MLGIQDLPLFVAAGLALNITPGQDTVYIVGRSAAAGLPAGIAAALGVSAGCLFHVGAAVLGVSALLASSAALFDALKLAGAAYLAWIAIGMLRAAWRARREPVMAPAASPDQSCAATPIGFWPVLRQGALTNLLNPKVALFFLAFLPPFVSPSAAHPALAMAVLGLTFCLTATLWGLFIAWSTARLTGRRGAPGRRGAWLQGAGGALLLWLALRLALTEGR
ncbi:MAG: LysE family translocator [Burkholderiales bacterium]|nr:LysE family translocator [Burkholderiales bacterium]